MHYCLENIKQKSNSERKALKRYEEDYSICHHCKYLFPNDSNYGSSLMRLPVPNPAYLDLMAASASTCKMRVPKRAICTNKRSVYSFDIRKNGELFCQRKFCRMCNPSHSNLIIMAKKFLYTDYCWSRVPYSSVMLEGSMRESKESVVKITRVSYQTFLKLLYYLYTDQVEVSYGMMELV